MSNEGLHHQPIFPASADNIDHLALEKSSLLTTSDSEEETNTNDFR